MNRRGFLKGLASAFAAPAIVRSGVLMPVRVIVQPEPWEVSLPAIIDRTLRADALKFSDIQAIVNVMRERNIPPMPDGRYVMVVPPTFEIPKRYSGRFRHDEQGPRPHPFRAPQGG